jgi:hypothetical protein
MMHVTNSLSEAFPGSKKQIRPVRRCLAKPVFPVSF